jgi:hypothetical protein
MVKQTPLPPDDPAERRATGAELIEPVTLRSERGGVPIGNAVCVIAPLRRATRAAPPERPDRAAMEDLVRAVRALASPDGARAAPDGNI